jgi:Rieske Fe-S protein
VTELEASRRNLLTGLAAAGVAIPVLAACGSDNGLDATGSASPGTGATSGSPGAPTGGTGASGGIMTSEIPVGGGKIFEEQKLVVTQPAAGEFKAFSAVCTHQGCLVSKIASGTIDCPCHGSKFSIKDGSVEDGPAPKPLPEKTVTVTGDKLTVS